MQLNTLKRKTANKKKKLVGRGGTRGKTSGRGTKGQNARAGHKKRPQLRDIIKKLPKLRGYRFNSTVKKPAVVNVGALNVFEAGAVVNPASIFSMNLIRKVDGQIPMVKILGTGELSKKLSIEKCVVSASAKAKIEKAGGEVK
jgi:large subunit ribosomal protein L15